MNISGVKVYADYSNPCTFFGGCSWKNQDKTGKIPLKVLISTRVRDTISAKVEKMYMDLNIPCTFFYGKNPRFFIAKVCRDGSSCCACAP